MSRVPTKRERFYLLLRGRDGYRQLLGVITSTDVAFWTVGDPHEKSYELFLLPVLGVFSMICSFRQNFQVFWDCKSIMSWNMALKFAGDTSNMLKKLYSEFQPKQLTWHMCFELKTTEKPPFFEISIIVAGRCWGFGGEILELPPKFKTGGRNSFVVVFVTLSIFFL